MIVRKATYDDIDRLMEIFESAKVIMRTSGNLEQWNGNYPTREIVCSDIAAGNCYVLCEPLVDEESIIIGTMALIPGPDYTYLDIDGEWPDDEPYYVIHRIATASPGRNVARTLLDWAFKHISESGYHVIRIDTHRDNIIMKHILTKYGFTPCGVIRLDDGSPRDAYWKTAYPSISE